MSTATKSPAARQTLAAQLDRLDAILDGLAEAIPAAVADAVRAAVAQAVREAVQAALSEVLATPTLLNRLREGGDSMPAADPAPLLGQVRQPRRPPVRVHALLTEARQFGTRLRTTAGERLGASRVWAGRQYDRFRPWRKPTLAALGIAATVSILGYALGPVAASILSGASAFGLSVTAAALVTAVKRPNAEATS